MARSLITIPGIEWQSLDGTGSKLVANVEMNFDVYEFYTVIAQAAFKQSGIARAVGFVVDNLENRDFVNVKLGPFSDRVPPFTKMPFGYLNGMPAPVFGALGGKPIVTFHTGVYAGYAPLTNVYGATVASATKP